MNFLPSVTLVTACYNFNNIHKGARTIEESIRTMESVLEIPCYLIIFTDKTLSALIKQKRQELGLFELTVIKEIEFENLWCYHLLEKVKHNREIYHPTKDARTCSETHLITCNKFDFILQAMEDNPFNSEKFAWIDSNCSTNMSKICENYSHTKLLYLLNNITDKFHIQILNVCDKKFKSPDLKKEFYSQYRWIVCGSFFTCGKKIGIPILNRLKEITVETTQLGYGHAEEMFYLEVLDEYYDDIVKSYGDYGQIINNFIKPTANINYIVHFMVKGYINYGYHKEGYDCCKSLLNEIKTFHLAVGYDVLLEIYFNYYVACFYHKNNESKQVVDEIMDIYAKNPYFKKEFDKNKDFFLNQFSYCK